VKQIEVEEMAEWSRRDGRAKQERWQSGVGVMAEWSRRDSK
jgi:hypothetical protein